MAIAYEQLGDDTISAIPVAKIQTDGYLFMWVINAKYRLAIEMISYSMGLSNIREREEGYRRCMQAHEMGENAVIHHLRHDKFAKIEEIIREARQRRVEAFLFATNTLAGQGLSAIFRNGWRVPQDFAIACFDTNEAFDIYKTAIAYVRQPIERFGTEALDLLIKSIEQRDNCLLYTSDAADE